MGLILAFDSPRLREVCEDADLADSEFGAPVAHTLRTRLADLIAAASPCDLLVGNPHVVPHGETECMSVSLGNSMEILFAANHRANPRDAADRIEWSKVRRIRIVEISNDDCHD
jgi:hypothetical protein